MLMQLTRSPETPDLIESDAALVSAVARGDRSALETVYREHSAAVMAAALRVTRDRTTAEDVTQEVFLRLWSRPERFVADRASLRTFLMVDARGRALDHLRAEGARRGREDRDARLESSTGQAGTEDMAMQKILSESVRGLLGHLKPELRDPIALTYLGGHTYREAARLLGQPEGTIKSRIRVGLERLEGLLAQLEPDAA
jgi:RNA polymerase sigma factor (sigma-70 family)